MPSQHAPTRTLLLHRTRVEHILRVLGRYGLAHMVAGSVHARLAEFLPDGLGHREEAMSDGERLRAALSELGRRSSRSARCSAPGSTSWGRTWRPS